MLDFAKKQRTRGNALSVEQSAQVPDSHESGAVAPIAEEDVARNTAPENPWSTINEMLIQNRCWLCQETFLRGKMKKVFMLSHLLTYVEERYKLEEKVAQDPNTPTCRLLNTDVAAVVNKAAQETHAAQPASDAGLPSTAGNVATSTHPVPPEGLTLNMLKTLESDNLRWCFEDFKALGGNKEAVEARLRAVECETWMSGLICARSTECAMEYLLIVPDGKVSTSVMVGDAGYQAVKSKNRDCPPDCGCDNPWAYISAALVDSAQ